MKTFYPLIWREEQLKNAVAHDWFSDYDTTKIIGNIDFCVAKPTDVSKGKQIGLWNEDEYTQSFLWAESKKGKNSDIYASFTQLIITIGKAKTFETFLPPVFLGAFDAEKIAFIPYSAISDIFIQNDFNWKVAPSDHSTKEFRFIFDKVKDFLQKKSYIFNYLTDEKELKKFIRTNFVLGRAGNKLLQITKNNFNIVYYKWLQTVKPTINVDWDKLKKANILDADFYLADLLSKDNESIRDSLFVLLKKNTYIFNKKTDELGLFTFSSVNFKDNQLAHKQFWNLYDRPPRKEFWDYIINRRDLLVPQDVRERKGSFFTPEKWVNLSQQYLSDVLGDDWQDEYYVWDCCAGTGNLLKGLQNKSHIWASTLDQADVDVMKDQIRNNNAPLFESHVFQMDFLNDKFQDKCPKGLLDIINNPEKRKKLVIYINPPYAEAGTVSQAKGRGTGKNKKDLTQNNKVYEKYKNIMGKACMELFAQFFIRIYCEIGGCVLAEFSKLKILQAGNFVKFRNVFQSALKKMFVVPANTFDNVKGQFPIGFMIWDTGNTEVYKDRVTDVYDPNGEFLFQKGIHCPSDNEKLIGAWITTFKDKNGQSIGMMNSGRNDFQNQSFCYIANNVSDKAHALTLTLTNVIPACIFLAVRHCIPATWLNDRDQFLYPNDGWKEDKNFMSDCLAFTLFHGQNHITCEEGTNHWIPFTEDEIGVKDEFESHFMTDYIHHNKITFTPTAQAVFDAGRELWKYYHQQPMSNPDASFYDIRAYFQGRKENGKMNAKSDDEHYTELIGNLRQKLKELAAQIKPKVYEYGFLIQ
jgi:hypothetical protein